MGTPPAVEPRQLLPAHPQASEKTTSLCDLVIGLSGSGQTVFLQERANPGPEEKGLQSAKRQESDPTRGKPATQKDLETFARGEQELQRQALTQEEDQPGRDSSEAVTASKPTKDSRGHKRSVKLKNWALARDSDGWRWFSWFGGQQAWRERGKAEVSSGRPELLAEELARLGGSITKPSVIRLFQEKGRGNWDRQAIFNSVCKPGKMVLAAAIRRDICRMSSQEVKENPIPWCREIVGWRCAIQIGYAIKNSDKKLVFRHADQVNDPDGPDRKPA